MPSKIKPAAPPAPAKRAGARPPKRVQPDLRWQRTQRYCWDRGGAKGGRR